MALPSVISSGDGLFAIAAPPLTADYRAPVLTFAHDVQTAMERIFHLAWPRPDHPILILLGTATNDTRIAAARVIDPTGGMRERIEIADPEHGDLDLLREALTRALLREWMVAASTNGVPKISMPPDGFVAGLARHLGGQHRLEDADSVYDQWSHGRLPPLRALLESDGGALMRHPPLQAVVAAWLLDQREGAALRLLQSLAGGARWSPALVAAAAYGAGASDLALDESWDAWQGAVIHQVRQLGTTTLAVARAFESQLLIYPADYGIVAPDGVRGLTPAACLELPRTDGLRDAVLDKARRLRLFAAGRDAALRQVAEAYARVLEGLGHGDPAASLRLRLAAADAAYRRLVARIEQGGPLRDPPPADLPSGQQKRGR